jgi:anti-sigma factor RsiW
LDLYVDGELDAAAGLELERHLEDCPDCTRARQQLLALRQALRAEVPRFAAPPRLRAEVQNVLRRGTRLRWAVPPVVWPWLTAAALLVAAGGVLFGWSNRQAGPAAQEKLAQEVVADHVRSLLHPRHLTDVASSDRHEVKPWFEGKTDYPPPVFDLDKEGFKLVGGRLDYLDRRAVAALVYERRLHKINLFVWPDDGAAPPVSDCDLRGYHLSALRHGGMTGWAVSDVDPTELDDGAAPPVSDCDLRGYHLSARSAASGMNHSAGSRNSAQAMMSAAAADESDPAERNDARSASEANSRSTA